MYHFHVNLVADPQDAPFAATWEDAAALLEQLPRMIFELDGSFVISGEHPRASASRAAGTVAQRWSGPDLPPTRWQVDGHLFDFAGRLHRLELHGQCPPDAFDDLLRATGWPNQPLAFEMVREGLTVDEREFRRRARA